MKLDIVEGPSRPESSVPLALFSILLARAPRQLHARRRAEVVLEDAPAGGAVDATAAVRHLHRNIK